MNCFGIVLALSGIGFGSWAVRQKAVRRPNAMYFCMGFQTMALLHWITMGLIR